MKKIRKIILFTIFFLITTSTFSNAMELSNNLTISEVNTYKPFKETDEELYEDIIMTMLNPYVRNAINAYYGNKYTVDSFNKILSIERPNGYRTLYFIIKLEVSPYEGAHNTVGVDHITFSIDSSNITLEKFEHIESKR